MKRFILSLCLLVLANCAGPVEYVNRPIEDAPEGKPTVAIAYLDGLDKPQYYKATEQSCALDLISAACTYDISCCLKKLDVQDILQEQFYGDFKKSLEHKSYGVKSGLVALNRKTLKKTDSPSPAVAPYLFSSLKNDSSADIAFSDADYALVLDPQSFGILRTYYSFIPTCTPHGLADLHFFLVRLEDNVVMGHFKARIERRGESDWDTPPDFTSMMGTVRESLKTALDRASTYLFDFDA